MARNKDRTAYNIRRRELYATRENIRLDRQERNLRAHYRVTLADYERILADQNFGCAICGKEAWEDQHGKLRVDHCHVSGKVRGLLCTTCNAGLGSFHDDPLLLDQAKTYLANRA